MAFGTVDGLTLLGATIVEPLVGVWYADLIVDGAEALSGAVTIDLGSETWSGTVIPGRSGAEGGHVKARVEGGAGGLRTALDPLYYREAPLSLVLEDILRETGETLATDADDLSDTFTPRWQRTAGTGGRALASLVDHTGHAWRIQRNGTLWIGADTYPEVEPNHIEDKAYPHEAAKLYLPNAAPLVRPGVTCDGERVSTVITTLGSSSLAQEVWRLETDGVDRLTGGLAAVVDSMLGRRLDYSRFYEATVVGQAADSTLELLADDERLRGYGQTAIPIRHGLPGFEVEVSAGARVRLGFDNGDPAKPFAALWDEGAVDVVTFDSGTEDVARTGDSAGEFYVDTLAVAVPAPSLYYRSPRGTGLWALVTSGVGPPAGIIPGTAVVIDEGNTKLKA